MYKITKLQVKNFRNLSNQVLVFAENINCIYGENGHGKTNILEAIYFLSHKKSFRKNTGFPQMLSMDSEQGEIILGALVQNEKKNFSYTQRITDSLIDYSIDGKTSKARLKIPTIFINPFHFYEFYRNESNRRELFDHLIMQVSEDYGKILNRFKKTISIKNALLTKKPNHYQEQIRALNPQLAEYSAKLTNMREKFLKELSPLIGQLFKEIFSEEHVYSITLNSVFFGKSADQIKVLYENSWENDNIRGRSELGSHRDEYILKFDEFNAIEYCSLGQQKTSYLSVLFAYIELFRYKYSYPIVLIDDISGELDSVRWKKLINYINKKKFQVIITTANEKFKEELDQLTSTKNIFVKNGLAISQF